jgi:hypothetical protein
VRGVTVVVVPVHPCEGRDEVGPGAGDPRPDGADRAAGHFRGLGVGQAEQLGQHERLAAVGVEPGQQVELLQRCAKTTAEAMPRLRTMKDLSDYWIEVNRIENEADKLYRRLLSRLYSGEFDALEILKLKEVADQLEEAADAFEHVANVVETIAVKES